MEATKRDDFRKYNLPENPNDFENIDVLEPTFGKAAPAMKKPKPYSNATREGNSSSYALFFREMQPVIRKEIPSASFGDLSRLIAARWDTLEEKHKREYRRRSIKAKRDRLREMAMFKVNQLCSSPKGPSFTWHPPGYYSSSSMYTTKNIYNDLK